MRPSDGGHARSAFITGSARGIGLAIATRLAGRGDHVTVADIDIDAAGETCVMLERQGLRARPAAVDVTQPEQIEAAMAEADRSAPLMTVVCNAGIGLTGGLLDTDEESFDRLMAVNLKGVFFTMQAALRVMVPRRAGNVVSISSTSAFTASTIPMAAYDASKAAVRMLTVSAAREVAAAGVRVNAVAPGTVATDLVRSVLGPDAMARLSEARIPLGRLAEPDEIAAAVAFLSSDDASYVTGHTLVADGGWLT
jgi:NAD(P)-dependent dehydrogenase (short-subunit alcohol dehydrogenase family)